MDTETSGRELALRMLASSDNPKALLDIVPDQIAAPQENILIGAAREIDELREALAALLNDYGLMEGALRMELAETRAALIEVDSEFDDDDGYWWTFWKFRHAAALKAAREVKP